MSHILTIATPRLYIPSEPIRDEKYKTFIRKLPCCACGSRKRVEAAHFGPHGISQKASDRDTLPLCRKCHRTSPISYHELGPAKFALAHKLHPKKQIAYLNQWYDERKDQLNFRRKRA